VAITVKLCLSAFQDVEDNLVALILLSQKFKQEARAVRVIKESVIVDLRE